MTRPFLIIALLIGLSACAPAQAAPTVTAAPTAAPTSSPTAKATTRPTHAPTAAPTVVPTAAPISHCYDDCYDVLVEDDLDFLADELGRLQDEGIQAQFDDYMDRYLDWMEACAEAPWTDGC